jgi:hypothetical protein
MPKIEEAMVLHGFAWIDKDGELNWALKTDLQGVRPEDRPEGATPVVIEISPVLEWVENKRKEHEFLGDLQEDMSRFAQDLSKLEHNMRLKSNG